MSWALKERAGNNDGNTIPELENENDKKDDDKESGKSHCLAGTHTHTQPARQFKARQGKAVNDCCLSFFLLPLLISRIVIDSGGRKTKKWF